MKTSTFDADGGYLEPSVPVRAQLRDLKFYDSGGRWLFEKRDAEGRSMGEMAFLTYMIYLKMPINITKKMRYSQASFSRHELLRDYGPDFLELIHEIQEKVDTICAKFNEEHNL